MPWGQQLFPQPGEPVGPATVFGAGDGRLGVLVTQLGPSGLGQPWGAYWGTRLGAGSSLGPALQGLWEGFAMGLRHPGCAAASGSAGTGAASSGALLRSLTEQQPGMLLAALSALPAAPQGGSAASTSG